MIKDDILYVTDFSGLLHCLHAKTGRLNWNHDLFAACWGSPLLVPTRSNCLLKNVGYVSNVPVFCGK